MIIPEREHDSGCNRFSSRLPRGDPPVGKGLLSKDSRAHRIRALWVLSHAENHHRCGLWRCGGVTTIHLFLTQSPATVFNDVCDFKQTKQCEISNRKYRNAKQLFSCNGSLDAAGNNSIFASCIIFQAIILSQRQGLIK